MNFQFTSKIKRNLFILIAAGLAMFVVGFLGEKNHLYTEIHSTHEGKEGLLVEYYKELPFTKDDFVANVKAAATEANISVDFADLTEGHGEEAHTAHHNEFEFKMLLTPYALESEGDHGNSEGQEESHGKNHEGSHSAESAHGAHGGVHHTPMETLEHILHEEGSFADKGHARTWSNLLVNGFFFFGIGLGALFFIALQ